MRFFSYVTCWTTSPFKNIGYPSPIILKLEIASHKHKSPGQLRCQPGLWECTQRDLWTLCLLCTGCRARRGDTSLKRFSFFWLQVSLFLSPSFCLFFWVLPKKSIKKLRMNATSMHHVEPRLILWKIDLREVNGCYTKTERVVNEAPVFVNRHGIILFRLGFFRGLSWWTLGPFFCIFFLPGSTQVRHETRYTLLVLHTRWPSTGWQPRCLWKNCFHNCNLLRWPRAQDQGCNRGK